MINFASSSYPVSKLTSPHIDLSMNFLHCKLISPCFALFANWLCMNLFVRELTSHKSEWRQHKEQMIYGTIYSISNVKCYSAVCNRQYRHHKLLDSKGFRRKNFIICSTKNVDFVKNPGFCHFCHTNMKTFTATFHLISLLYSFGFVPKSAES